MSSSLTTSVVSKNAALIVRRVIRQQQQKQVKEQRLLRQLKLVSTHSYNTRTDVINSGVIDNGNVVLGSTAVIDNEVTCTSIRWHSTLTTDTSPSKSSNSSGGSGSHVLDDTNVNGTVPGIRSTASKQQEEQQEDEKEQQLTKNENGVVEGAVDEAVDDEEEVEEETGFGVIFGTRYYKEIKQSTGFVFDGPDLPVLPVADVYTIPQPSDELEPKTLWTRIKDEYSWRGQRERMWRAEGLFQACTRQANNPLWYGPGRIPNTFRSRHAILTMHIWFLHRRLIVDEYDYNMAEAIQEDLFQILWDDTQCRIRKEGVNELVVNKLTLQVQQYTFLHLANYDYIYKEFRTDPQQRLKELRKLIYLHILVRPQPEEQYINRIDHLDRIAWYIDCNYINTMFEWPDDLYRRSAIAWTTIPDFTRMIDSDGRTVLDEDSAPMQESDLFPYPWQRNITLRGDYYYWNQYTRDVSWEKPIGDDEEYV